MRYAKFGVAAVAVVLAYFVNTWTGGSADPAALANVVIAGLAAASVGLAPNTPAAPALKASLASIAALFGGLNNLLGGVTPPHWWQLAVTVAGAIAVYLVPNR